MFLKFLAHYKIRFFYFAKIPEYLDDLQERMADPKLNNVSMPENFKVLLGRWLDHQCQKMRHVSTGSLDKALLFCRRARGLQKRVQRRKDPPCSSLTQAMDLSPSHGSGQGAHPSRSAHLKHIVPGSRGKRGIQEGETGAKWSHQDVL